MNSPTQRYLNSQPGSQDDQLADRKFLRDMEDAGVAALGPLDERLEEVYIQIPIRDENVWHSTCKIIRPRAPPSNNKPRPLIVMLHGGGWIRGSPEMFTRPGREFALAFDAVVVSVEYRLAPEYKWPQAVFDVWDICVHITEAALAGNNPELFGSNVSIDPSGFILAGASAGANIACAITSISLLSTSGPSDPDIDHPWDRSPLKMPVRGICLSVPFLITAVIVPPAYKEQFTSRLNSHDNMQAAEHAFRLYQPDQTSPMFSPVNMPSEKLTRWPRTYFQVGERDIWRDDAVIFKSILEHNGVKVRMDKYVTLAHVTWSAFTTGEDMGVDSELGGNTMAAMSWLLDGK